MWCGSPLLPPVWILQKFLLPNCLSDFLQNFTQCTSILVLQAQIVSIESVDLSSPQHWFQNFFLTWISRSCILSQISCNATLFQCFALYFTSISMYEISWFLTFRVFDHNLSDYLISSNFNLKMQNLSKMSENCLILAQITPKCSSHLPPLLQFTSDTN